MRGRVIDFDKQCAVDCQIKHRKTGELSEEFFYIKEGKLFQVVGEGVGIPVDEFFEIIARTAYIERQPKNHQTGGTSII